MTPPLWALLGFATWTLVLLIATIGAHRVSLVLRGRARVAAFPADQPHGPDWYRRAMRAHANCVENLPVLAAVVAVASFARVTDPVLDACAMAVLPARIAQSLVHVALVQTDRVVAIRFTFFVVQVGGMLSIAAVTALHALG